MRCEYLYERIELSEIDRSMVEIRLRDGWSISKIAEEIHRDRSVVSREVSRNGGRDRYLAQEALMRAVQCRALRRRPNRMSPGCEVFEGVATLLRRRWSPEQISGRAARMEDNEKVVSGINVSHEAIYLAIYALPRGELKKELIECLRQSKPHRGRRSKATERRGKLKDMVNISMRPEEVEGRIVPGHWEGDLIVGEKGASAIGTLVERTTRLVVLVKMPSKAADVAGCAFAGALNKIPAPLRKTLTYDQGKEMAAHQALAAATDMKIYFADPHSPWQRGANENTNGLLRQYFPKGSALSRYTQEELDEVAQQLNDRPRKVLCFATPYEAFTKLLAGFGENLIVARTVA